MTRPPLILPPRDDLFRIAQIVFIPKELRGPNLERIAHHEAGHIVQMRWAGLEPKHATATPTAGVAEFCEVEPVHHPIAADDQTLVSAWCASVYHAGVIAELIHAGLPWTGVLYRPQSQDWKNATLFLGDRFFGTAGHAYAQRVAHAVLTHHWPEVQRIAAHLISNGSWTPADDELRPAAA